MYLWSTQNWIHIFALRPFSFVFFGCFIYWINSKSNLVDAHCKSLVASLVLRSKHVHEYNEKIGNFILYIIFTHSKGSQCIFFNYYIGHSFEFTYFEKISFSDQNNNVSLIPDIAFEILCEFIIKLLKCQLFVFQNECNNNYYS